MALSSTTYTDGNLPPLNTASTALSVGKFLSIETLDLDTDISNGMRNTAIEVSIGWGPVGGSGPSEMNGVGFTGFLGQSNTIYTLSPGADPVNGYFYLFDVVITRNSTTSIDIDIEAFIQMDTNGPLNDTQTFNPPSPLYLLNIDDSNAFSTISPSLFKEERELIITIVIDNDPDTFTFRKKMRARHWNKDIDGTAQSDITGQLWEVPQDITPGQNIPIKLTFNTLLTLDPIYTAGFMRSDNPIGGNEVVTSTQLTMRDSSLDQVNSRIPFSDIINMGAITSIGTNLYEVSFELLPTAPVDGVNYYAFLLFKVSGEENYHAILSYDQELDTTYPASSGDVEIRFAQYDKAGTIFGSDCVVGVAPRERLNFSVTMDKTSYNQDIIDNNVSGTFDSNFRSALVGFSTDLPGTINDLLAISRALSPQEITDGTANMTLSAWTRIPSEWANQTGFLFFTYVFEVFLVGTTSYFDYIVVPIRLIVEEYDDKVNGKGLLSLLSVKDENGVETNPALCLDSVERLIFTFSLSGVVDPSLYNFIPYIREVGREPVLEFNVWDNPNLRRLEEEFFIRADDSFIGGEAEVEIDPQLIKVNSSFCIGAISKIETPDTPPIPSECPTFDLVLSHSSDQVGEFSWTYGVGVTLSNFSLPNISIELISVITTVRGDPAPFFQDSAKGFDDVSFTEQIGVYGAGNYTLDYFIQVVTVDDQKRTCEYIIKAELLMNVQVGQTFSRNLTLTGVSPNDQIV